MANQRPIRRGRVPFRRKRRPVRWVDANSAAPATAGSFVLPSGSILPIAAGGTSTQNYRELVVGDLDTEWSDANEVLLERVVGDISVTGRSKIDLDGTAGDLFINGGPLFPVIRMGLLLVEGDDEADTPTPTGMWTADDLRDGEWMWLRQIRTATEGHMFVDSPGSEAIRLFSEDVHLDCRVKRKLGRRDRLVLCHEFTMVGTTFTGSHVVDVQPLLRCLVSTR